MQNAYIQALEFLVDAGIDVAVMAEPNNRFEAQAMPTPALNIEPTTQARAKKDTPSPLQPHADIIKQAEGIASQAENLDDLRAAITAFDGISIKKNASHLVFGDGNATAKIMVIGDVPSADDDRQGLPFMGASGQLCDKIFESIGFSRLGDAPDNAIYLATILNWRPPGNRTPKSEEIEISIPFIKRHIALVNPDVIVCLGGMPAQNLLNVKESISRLRGIIHDYNDTTKLIATYHPTSLINTPLQKKKVWQDMLMLKDFINA